MANWYGAARSNYVKIKDMRALEDALEPFPIRVCLADDQPGLVCFLSEEQDSGGWPSWAFVSDVEGDGANEVEFNPAVQICPFMEEDQILVMMEAGHEKLRYISGVASAYNSQGECVSVSLGDIYQKAAEHFKVPRSDITAAEY